MNFKSVTQSTAKSGGGFSLGKGCLIAFLVLAILWIGSWMLGTSLWGLVFSPSQEVAELVRISTPQGDHPFIVEYLGEGILLTGNDGVQMLCMDVNDLTTCIPFVNAQGATLSNNEPVMPDKVDICLDSNGGTTCVTTGKPRASRSYK